MLPMSSPAHSSLVGIAVVRGGGAPLQQWRLPRRSPASLGKRERYAFALQPEWVPKDIATFTPVEDGWLCTNLSRDWMRLESDFILGGSAVFGPQAVVMLQRGDHRVGWSGLGAPLNVSVTVRTRRLEDQRLPYAGDSTVDAHVEGTGSYLGVTDAPMTAALRYRLAVLFRHLIEGELEPRNLLQRRAEALAMPAADLEAAAHRLRRRLNVVHGLDLQSIEELGEYLVLKTDQLTRVDLEP